MENMGLAPAFGQNNIPVVLSANNLYAPYAGVFIQSLIDHACPEKNYDIIIFERDISPENKRLLLMLRDKEENISIRFYNPFSIFDMIDISSIEVADFPAEVYCKILAPHILPQYPKLLVVDSDTLLQRDISKLFEMDIAPYPMGAALDITWHGCYKSNFVFSRADMGLQDYCRSTLTMKDPLQYVNTGVLLFDSEKYRRELSLETVLHTAQGEMLFPEQDVLNLLMEGKIKFLNPAWNTLLPINHTISEAIARAPEEGRLAHQKAYEQPYLLHWAAKPKPWVCPDVVLGYEWWAVAQKTPFVGHIIARMFDALEARRQRYMDKYGQNVDAWDPAPEIIKRKPYEARCAPVGH